MSAGFSRRGDRDLDRDRDRDRERLDERDERLLLE